MGFLMRILIFILVLCLPALCCASQVYKWRDQSGNIHYSDIEPIDQTAQNKRIKPSGPKPVTPDQAKLASQKALCDAATKNYVAISNPNNTVIKMTLGDDGISKALTPEQRVTQTEILKARVTISCTQ
jgi:Domain of unknown function (DUF4124)